MKAFRDLQKGDKIYYWDKGELHEQIVHEIEIKDEISSYTDWSGMVTKHHREVVYIVAGKNNRTKLRFWGAADKSTIRYGMLRFSCLEAAKQWLFQQKTSYKIKINYLKNRIAHLENCYESYNNPKIIEAIW